MTFSWRDRAVPVVFICVSLLVCCLSAQADPGRTGYAGGSGYEEGANALPPLPDAFYSGRSRSEFTAGPDSGGSYRSGRLSSESEGGLYAGSGTSIFSKAALPSLPDQGHYSGGIGAVWPRLIQAQTPSRLEEYYSRRTNEDLVQFGYRALGGAGSSSGAGEPFHAGGYPDVFTNGLWRGQAGGVLPSEIAALRSGDRLAGQYIPRGGIADDFVLGFGDRLRITFSGQRNASRTYEIGSDGRLAVEGLGVVSVAGRKISELRAELQALAAAQHNMKLFVSIDSVGQIGVLVLGQVAAPGRIRLSAFDSVLDALAAAGGIEKTGSLRRVRVVRGGQSRILDLYNLLLDDVPGLDLSIKDADRIIVPPIGPTIAIAGSVKRPGIYELPASESVAGDIVFSREAGAGKTQKREKPDQESMITAAQALQLAGGTMLSGENRILHHDVKKDGGEATQRLKSDELDHHRLSDGSIIRVERKSEVPVGRVLLLGHSSAAGTYDIADVPTLAALLPGPDLFGPDIYPLLGLIVRHDQGHFGKNWIGFPPYLLARGKFDRRLKDGDKVLLFSSSQVRAWLERKDEIVKGRNAASTEWEEGTYWNEEERENLMRPYEHPDLSNLLPAAYYLQGKEIPELAYRDPELYRFLKEHAISLRGAVRHPGLYPVADDVSLQALLSAAGGLTVHADRTNVEVTGSSPDIHGMLQPGTDLERLRVNLTDPQYRPVLLGPGDSVRVKDKRIQALGHKVVIKGEIRYPGIYDLAPGDTLLSLIERAGGLTEQAYPAGAIFSRKEERRLQEKSFRAQARELQLTLSRELSDKENRPSPEELRTIQELIFQLNHASGLGRVTVEADPAVLRSSKELDLLLQDGDKVYIPKRPLHVRVNGEVLSPASLQFRKDKDAPDYIREAGGFTERADKKRTFIVFPDGSATPLEMGTWSHNAALIPPGSTIIVPLDADRISFLEKARDISQILTNLTISAVFLEEIGDD